MEQVIKHWFPKLLTWSLLAAAFVPLIYVSSGGVIYPFTTGKIFAFRTLVEIAVALAGVLVATGYRGFSWGVLRRTITWIPAGMLAWGYVSAWFGIDFYHSFWSIFERGDGLVTATHVTAYFYLVLLAFDTKEWRTFFALTAGTGTVVALYGLGQKLGFPGLIHTGMDRVEGTIGNAAFLAGYLVLTAGITAYMAYTTKRENARWWWAAGAVLQVVVVFLSETRGAILALLGTAMFLLVYGAFFIRAHRVRMASLAALVLLVASMALGYVYRDTLAESNIGFLKRLGQISLDDPTTKSRLFIWKNSLAAAGDRFTTGYGPENFEYVYNRYYDPSIVTEEWFDRAHNAYVDALIQTGAVGFALLVALLVLALQLAWRRRADDEWVGVILGATIIAYAAQNFFVFDTIATSALFLALTAFLISARHGNPVTEKIKNLFAGNSTQYAALGYAVAVVAAGSWYWVNWLPLQANVALADGYMYQVADTKRSIASLERGLSYGTFADMEYAYQAYDMYFNKKEYGKLTPEDMLASYEFSLKMLEDAIERYPWNVRLYIYWGHIVEGRPAGGSYDEVKLEAFLSKAIELSPKRSQSYYMLANIYLNKSAAAASVEEKTENTKRAVSVLERYVALVPDYVEPNIILANILRVGGMRDEADRYFKQGIRRVTDEPDPSLARRILEYYLGIRDYKNAQKYYEYLLKNEPMNYDFWFDLAHIYALNGDREKARAAVEIVQKGNPKILEKDPAFAATLLRGQ